MSDDSEQEYCCEHGVPSGRFCSTCDDEVPLVTDYPCGDGDE